MFFIVGDIWTLITIKLIGGVLRLAWFLTRTAAYLALFLILSAAAGVAALIRGRNHDELAGTGEYIDDGLYWRDAASGQLFHVHASQTEHCEVRAADRGMDWRRSTLSRFMRDPAVIRWQFDAVTDGSSQVAGSVAFPRHARGGIHHIDDLDPRSAALETTDMTEPLVWAGDHDSAAAALQELDFVLQARGWEADSAYGDHWYSRRYRRPVILSDQPVQATENPAIAAPAPVQHP
jgi:hypothetical protein